MCLSPVCLPHALPRKEGSFPNPSPSPSTSPLWASTPGELVCVLEPARGGGEGWSLRAVAEAVQPLGPGTASLGPAGVGAGRGEASAADTRVDPARGGGTRVSSAPGTARGRRDAEEEDGGGGERREDKGFDGEGVDAGDGRPIKTERGAEEGTSQGTMYEPLAGRN